MKVLIVGAGIAGLTLAALLKRKGIESEIIEKARKWKRVGFSIGIWNNGRRIIRELGVEKEFDKKGYSIPDYSIATGDGHIMRLYHFDEFTKKYNPVRTQILRADLQDLLRKAAKEVKVTMGLTISSINQNESGVEVKFSNGAKKKYDLVVGADGIDSQVRELVFGNGYVNYLGWRGWFFWTERNNRFPKGVFEMWEPEQFFGVFPHGDKKVCTYLAMPFDKNLPDNPDTRIERFKKHFTGLKWQVPEIIEKINPKKMVEADLAYVKMDKWHKGRVIVIGDAAHAMEPFAGMGGSMAMEDALVLAEELAQADENEISIQEAFDRYQKRREPRVRLAEDKTRQIWGVDKNKIACYLLL